LRPALPIILVVAAAAAATVVSRQCLEVYGFMTGKESCQLKSAAAISGN